MPPADPLSIPTGTGAPTRREVEAWYRNIQAELADGFLAGERARHVEAYYRDAGLLTPWRRPFFDHHYCESFLRSATFLLGKRPRPRILDLGCGTGTQSLFLALHGARVVALDLDRVALDVLRTRIAFYEKRLGRKLDIQVHCANTFEFDYAAVAPIDGVYSMFAFNMMQPSEGLLQRLLPALAGDARFAIIDGNSVSWLSRWAPGRRRSALSPSAFANLLGDLGFVIREHTGGVAVPPVAWRALPRAWLSPIDRALTRSWFFSVSHLLHAERDGGNAGP